MSSSHTSPPRPWPSQLAQDEVQGRQRAAKVDLAPPSALQAEQGLLEALLTHEKEHSAPQSLWQRSTAWWRARPASLQWLVPSSAFAALFVLFWFGPQSAGTGPHQLRPKGGGSTTTRPTTLTLHLGRWSPSQKKLTRFLPGQHCSSRESVVFGFSVRHSPGHLTLFHERLDKRQSFTIYPFNAKQSKEWRPAPGLQLIKNFGTPQRYTLNKEKGRQRFVALFSKTPLTKAERTRWQASLKDTAKDFAKRLKTTKLDTKVHGWDSATIDVRRASR